MRQRPRPKEKLQMYTKWGWGEDEVGLGEFFGQFLAEFLGVLLYSQRRDLYACIACQIRISFFFLSPMSHRPNELSHTGSTKSPLSRAFVHINRA